MADMNTAALLAQMTPEELRRMFEQGPLAEDHALLENQMAQAEALRSQPHQLHSTGAGGAFGALGDVLRTVAGYKGEDSAREGLQKNAAAMADSRLNGQGHAALRIQALINGLSQGGAGGAPSGAQLVASEPWLSAPMGSMAEGGAPPGAPGQPPLPAPGYGTGAQIQQPTPMALRRRPLGPFDQGDDSDPNAGY